MDLPIILAFGVTLITASSNILLKKGFYHVNPLVGVYLSVLVSAIFLWIATFLIVPRSHFYNYKGMLIFIVIGGFSPTIVRTLTYYGIDKLGAGRAALMRAMTPFFAIVMAIIFFKESPKPGIFIGILFIALGIIFLAKKEENGSFSHKPIHFLYPLGAAILSGFAINMCKYGLNVMPQALFASTIVATSSLIILTFYIFFKHAKKRTIGLSCMKELKFIVIAAFLTSCGEILGLSALLYGKVRLVASIFAITPLMIVFLSRIFLKEQEMITKQVIFSTFLIIFGICFAIMNT